MPLDLAAIGALIVADGAMLGPDDAQVPFDPANPDHEITSIVVHSYYCGSDPCKNGNKVETADLCVKEANGETKALEQGGHQSFPGSSTSGPVDPGTTIEGSATDGGRICYTVRDLSQPIK